VCFSAQADLIGGLALTAIGFDALRHVRRRRDHLALAALPLLLALHQLDEAFVWWGLQGHVPPGVGRAAMWAYLVFAFMVLPVYVPLAIRVLEPAGRRRAVMSVFALLGAAVSASLLAAMIRGPVTARLGDFHLVYSVHLHAGLLIVSAYVAATCGSAVLSGYRHVARFGVLNLIAVAVLARLTLDGFASLWCAWAVVAGAGIALHLRSRNRSRTVTELLA